MKTTRGFDPADRYKYDFGLCSYKNGWAQVDTSQDASYYGTWANPFRLEIFTYVEGDTILNKAESPQEFVKELETMKAWNIECGHKFHGIDTFRNDKMTKEFVKIGTKKFLYSDKKDKRI